MGSKSSKTHSAGPSTERAARPSYLSVITTKVKKDGETALEETEGLEYHVSSYYRNWSILHKPWDFLNSTPKSQLKCHSMFRMAANKLLAVRKYCVPVTGGRQCFVLQEHKLH